MKIKVACILQAIKAWLREMERLEHVQGEDAPTSLTVHIEI